MWSPIAPEVLTKVLDTIRRNDETQRPHPPGAPTVVENSIIIIIIIIISL